MSNRTQYLINLATLDGLAGVAMADKDREIREAALALLIAAGRDGVAALMARS
jgi:hypothetical protein